MKADKYKVDGSEKIDIRKLPVNSNADGVTREDIETKYAAAKEEIVKLDDAFRADAREGLIFVIQALDASGKDSTIEHVFSGLNPQGVKVHYYKAPTDDELAHDYLWRIHKDLPRKGEIAVLNRSHYEDLVTVDVEGIRKIYKMAERIANDSDDTFFNKRYEQVRNFEEYLYENSFRMVKIFLHVTKKEEATQMLERLDVPDKSWKFRSDDIKVLDKYDDYMKCFNKVINETATKHSPWYVLPGNQRWYTRYLLTEIIAETLKECKPKYPAVPPEEKAKFPVCREALQKIIEREK
ncbi:MAG: PPK2 family polyphosphate kinase [Eubacterium sp.]|jgi:PPK2 family polyphosphate:nucleotide phosphotransferase